MTAPLTVGIELPDAELAALLGQRLGDVPEQLDASGAAYLLLGADRTTPGLQSGSPTLVGTVLARRTRGIGIGVGSSPQRDHPYNAARRVASLDHLSGGRAGLLALARDSTLTLGAGDGTTWAPVLLDAAHRADAITATRKLWRTWPIESLDADPQTALATAVHYADHVGTFSTRGPLNVPTTPQGEPLVFWAAQASGDALLEEITIAAAVADVVVVDATALTALDPAALTAILHASEAVGRPAQLHARIESGKDATVVVTSLGRRPQVSGVTIRSSVRDLAFLSQVVLPALTASGAVAPRPDGATTLRELLGVARRAEPDLRDNATAFPPRNSTISNTTRSNTASRKSA